MANPYDAKLNGTEHSQGWSQLFRFANAGIPYAADILRSLHQTNLTFPGLVSLGEGAYDLCYYSTVHHAYRNDKLTLFLDFMNTAKEKCFWGSIRDNRETQIIVIDVFLRKQDAKSILEAVRLIPTWLYATESPDRYVA
jgi:hypothetical protein